MARPVSQGGIDYPDGGFYSGTDLHPITEDLGELVARQGYPTGIDRRGNVIYKRDFRYGFDPAEVTDAGLGEEVRMSTFAGIYGGYSVRLGKLASTASYSGLEIRTLARSEGRMGGEAAFAITTNYPNLILRIYRYTGSQLINWSLRWDTSDGKIYLRDDNGAWVEATDTQQCLIGYPLLHSMKLVGDEANQSYERAIIDGQEITLPAVSPEVTSSSTNPHVLFRFFNAGGPSYGCFVYVDYILITVNEPPS